MLKIITSFLFLSSLSFAVTSFATTNCNESEFANPSQQIYLCQLYRSDLPENVFEGCIFSGLMNNTKKKGVLLVQRLIAGEPLEVIDQFENNPQRFGCLLRGRDCSSEKIINGQMSINASFYQTIRQDKILPFGAEFRERKFKYHKSFRKGYYRKFEKNSSSEIISAVSVGFDTCEKLQ